MSKDILSSAQKRFSLLSGIRNVLPTLAYHTCSTPLPPTDKITLFTCNIFPPNMVVWHHLVRKFYGDGVDTFIFDCGGGLDPATVPGAKVQRYINAMHPTKIDVFLQRAAQHRKYVWICDDDVFAVSSRALDVLHQEFAQSKTATVSLRPRTWWHFAIDGKEYEPSGSYCIALDREIFKKEGLNAQPADGNTHPSHRRKPMKRYDTLDKSNEELIQRGYRCAIVPEDVRNNCVVGFDGTSIAALVLAYFGTPERVLDCFRNATQEQWGGNVYPRMLAAVLSGSAVLQLGEKIMGKPTYCKGMPTPEALAEIRAHAEPLLTEDRNFRGIDTTYDQLLSSI